MPQNQSMINKKQKPCGKIVQFNKENNPVLGFIKDNRNENNVCSHDSQRCMFSIYFQKYDDLIRINANIRVKRLKKGENRKNSLYLGEKYDFEKRRGAKKSIIFIIYTPDSQ